MSTICEKPPAAQGHSPRRAQPRPAMTVSWRDVLPIHPAAELFPPMAPAELRVLGEDIKQNGLNTSLALCKTKTAHGPCTYQLLDGRNRLDAMEAVGLAPKLTFDPERERWILTLAGVDEDDLPQPWPIDGDPFVYVISANLHRRHLTARKRRQLIANLIKADPSKSDRQIAKTVNVDDKTVAKVRRKMEGRSEIPNVETRTDSKGRKQPARKPRSKPKPKPEPSETGYEDWNAGEISRNEAEGRGDDTRPPAPNPVPVNSQLSAFDLAIKFLRRLQGEPPTRFAQTYHSASDLENVEAFIRDVIKAKTTAPAPPAIAPASAPTNAGSLMRSPPL
jgi:hypothetical protein